MAKATQKIWEVNEFVDKVKLKVNTLSQKQYAERNSLLTDLYHQDKNISTVYHMCLAVFIGLFIYSNVYEYLYRDEFSLGLTLIVKSFPNVLRPGMVWLLMFLSTTSVYCGFNIWATVRMNLHPKSNFLNIWDSFMLILIVSYHIVFLSFFPFLCYISKFTIGITFVLLTEDTRMTMKTYAFVRSNVPRVLAYKPHSEIETVCPSFQKFLYFSFAPALIYQDEYPRTKSINWKCVFTYVAEFIVSVVCLNFLFQIFFIQNFEHYGLRHYDFKELTVIILKNSIPTLLIFVLIFYIVLHIWMNLFAELLQFGDRMFYKDWWTSSNYDRYYRTWNVVVHDWLYVYVYKDFYENVFPKNKNLAKFMVFFISAVFHEYILAFAFGFFLPVLFIEFLILGVPMTFAKFKHPIIGNTILWLSLGSGNSFAFCIYAMEYYARQNCSPNEENFSYFIPQLLYCNKS